MTVLTNFEGELGTARPNDVALSADGTRLFAAGEDGNLRVYDTFSGQLLATVDVGVNLGAIDISPDGSFLMAVEAAPLVKHEVASGNPTYTVAAYRVDLSSGAVTRYLYHTTSSDYTFNDVAVMDDGTVLFSQNIFPGWSGSASLKLLDLETGEFAVASGQISQSPIVSAAEDGSVALLAPTNISDAPLFVYASGSGIVADHEGYENDVIGFNDGVQALSSTGLVAQFVYGSGLHIYDANLNYRTNLASKDYDWYFSVTALTFDASGAFLFVLDTSTDEIVQLRTSNWSIVHRIPVGADLTEIDGDFGNRLLVSPDLRFFTVVTETGLQIINNPFVGKVFVGDGADDSIVGTAYDDEIVGGGGSDALNGGDGNDSLNAGPGNDFIDGGAGHDTVSYADASVGVTVDLDIRTAQDTGGVGNDTLRHVENLDGSAHGDVLIGDEYSNILSGGAGADRLVGRAGNDRLVGGSGIDAMYGGIGNDTYVIDSTSDATVELADEGIDTVESAVSHTLRANIENLTLTGAGSIYGKGNALANTIVGTAGSNNLYGLNGDDKLVGHDGNDRLDGGAGADRMYGGTGSDIFVVDDAGDRAYDELFGGTDIVISSVDFALGANLEQLTLIGTAIRGTGNELANQIKGNAVDNILSGGLGDDSLYGLDGSDIVKGDFGNDVLRGGLGEDRLYGGDGADVVSGEDGNDWLEGGAARDRFLGGTGADSFVFRAGDFAGVTTSTADQIQDFSHADGDRIRLSLVDADSTIAEDQAFAFIGTGAFTGTAGELRYQQISGNTYVHGDTDGDGVADFWIRLDGLHELVAGDFVL